MGVFLWTNYWMAPGDSFSDPPPRNLQVTSVITSGPIDIGGSVLYLGRSWISYTPSVALSLVAGQGNSLVLASNTITGRYRQLSSEFVLFELRGNLVFGTGTGQAQVILGLPPIPAVVPFSTSGSFIGNRLSTNFAVPLIGYSSPGNTTVTIAPAQLIDSSGTVGGINAFAPASKIVTITVSGIYEVQ